MANLNSILKEILLKEDKITVPGLGTFEASYQSAQLDEKTGVIHPPTKLVTLNTQAADDSDNALIKKINVSQGIPEDLAKTLVDDFVKAVKAKLAENSSYTIEEIGSISKDENGNIVLSAVPSNLSIDNYGMETVEIEPVQPGDRVVAAPVASTSKGKSVKTDTKTTSKVTTTKTTTTTTEKKVVTTEDKPKKSSLLKLLVILLPILAVLSILFFIFKDQILGFFNPKPVDEPEPAEYYNDNGDDISQEDPSKIDITETPNMDPDLEILARAGFINLSAQDLGAQYKKYYLIGGSFRDKDNAMKVKRQLKAEDVLKVADSEYYRVYIIASDDAKDVVDAFNQAIARGIRQEDMWLLKNSKISK